ncbi:hypothetical protein ACWD7F_36180 [Streptomyces sp. NPDC005122]
MRKIALRKLIPAAGVAAVLFAGAPLASADTADMHHKYYSRRSCDGSRAVSLAGHDDGRDG